MSSVAVGITSGLLMGIVFGFALEKSRVFEPGIIVGQMQLRNWIMLKVFLTAVATGAVVLAVLNGFGFVKLQPKAALYAADIVGGLISAPASRLRVRVPAPRWRKSASAIAMPSLRCSADCPARSRSLTPSPGSPSRSSVRDPN